MPRSRPQRGSSQARGSSVASSVIHGTVTHEMIAEEAAFLESLPSALPEDDDDVVTSSSNASSDNTTSASASASSSSTTTSSAQHALLEVMLAQAAKFSEFVNESLGIAAASSKAAAASASACKPGSRATPTKRGKRPPADSPATRDDGQGKRKRQRCSQRGARVSGAASVTRPQRASASLKTLPQPSTLKGTLRDYQLEGFTWLSKL